MKKNRIRPFEELIPDIKEMISDYKYGQYNILESSEEFQIKYNPIQKALHIYPLHQFNSESNMGTCSELVHSTYVRMKSLFNQQNHPELNIFRVEGNDNNFFKRNNTGHTFLILSQYNMVGNNPNVGYDPKEIPKKFKEDLLMIDPSFRIITSLPQSKYKIKKIFSEEFPITYTKGRTLQDQESAVLCMNGKYELITLKIDFNSAEILNLGINKKNESTQYPISSPQLDKMSFHNPKVKDFIEFFRSQQKMMTQIDQEIPEHFRYNETAIQTSQIAISCGSAITLLEHRI